MVNKDTLLALQAKINEKNTMVLELNDYIKKLQQELVEVKKERDELKLFKDEREAEEKEAMRILGEIDKSIDETYAKIEMPPK